MKTKSQSIFLITILFLGFTELVSAKSYATKQDYSDCYVERCESDYNSKQQPKSIEQAEKLLEEMQLFNDCVENDDTCKATIGKLDALGSDQEITEDIYNSMKKCYLDTTCVMPNDANFKDLQECKIEYCMVDQTLSEIIDFLIIIFSVIALIALYIFCRVIGGMKHCPCDKNRDGDDWDDEKVQQKKHQQRNKRINPDTSINSQINTSTNQLHTKSRRAPSPQYHSQQVRVIR